MTELIDMVIIFNLPPRIDSVFLTSLLASCPS